MGRSCGEGGNYSEMCSLIMGKSLTTDNWFGHSLTAGDNILCWGNISKCCGIGMNLLFWLYFHLPDAKGILIVQRKNIIGKLVI